MTTEALAAPLRFLKGVGPRRAADLEHASLLTIEDLLYRFPIRYEDRSQFRPIATIEPGQTVSIQGRVLGVGLRSTRRPGFNVFEAVVSDDSGSLRAVWLNQPFLRDVFSRGQRVVLFGPVEMRPQGRQLTNPQYEILDDEEGETVTVHTGRIVPIYERTGSVTPKVQRKLVYEALQRVPADLTDPLPDTVRVRMGLPDRAGALSAAHFPPGGTSIALLNRFATPAQRRLIFEEAFLFRMGVIARRRAAWSERKPVPIVVDDRIREAARQVLPFRLTPGQRRALKEIVDDLQRAHPMNRLLQGDVGAGKTIVALLAAIVAMENGLQVAFMAPTEILAEQHYLNIARLLEASRFRVALLTGSRGAAARARQLADLAGGGVHLVVGTHALVQQDVRFARLGFVIIDEQHRFGVVQRAVLRSKGLRPDVLVMTATPIPRTLALTAYGDLEVSVIRDLPPGRLPVKTAARPERRRDEIYAFIRRQLEAGRLAYIVYPLVEESSKIDLKAATGMADHLAREIFPSYRVGLLHGRLKPEEKERVMAAFAAGELQVLVATTVVEVGLDVPHAGVMLVEHAERLGLSQLHQLRGRVGRDGRQAYCFLLYQSPLSEIARERLEAVSGTADGFEIAEHDLRLRGPGDLFGTRQAGVPTFRLIDLVRDRELLELADREASAWFDAAAPTRAAIETLLENWESRFKLVGIG